MKDKNDIINTNKLKVLKSEKLKQFAERLTYYYYFYYYYYYYYYYSIKLLFFILCCFKVVFFVVVFLQYYGGNFLYRSSHLIVSPDTCHQMTLAWLLADLF